MKGGQDIFRDILFFKLENHGSGEGPRLIFWSPDRREGKISSHYIQIRSAAILYIRNIFITCQGGTRTFLLHFIISSWKTTEGERQVKYLASARGQEKSVHITYKSNNDLIATILCKFTNYFYGMSRGARTFFVIFHFSSWKTIKAGGQVDFLASESDRGKEKLVHIQIR